MIKETNSKDFPFLSSYQNCYYTHSEVLILFSGCYYLHNNGIVTALLIEFTFTVLVYSLVLQCQLFFKVTIECEQKKNLI